MPFILILIYFYSLSCAFDARSLSAFSGCPLYCYLTFSLVHVSFFHLLTNSVVIMSYWRLFKGIINYRIFIPSVIIIPAVSAMVSVSVKPTMGASAVAYTMMGLFVFVYPLRRKDLVKYLSAIIFSFAVTLFAGSVNTEIHIVSFALSIAVGYTFRKRMVL